MSLKVYTASAGSGKTHALTREFLRLMLSTDDPRHFTTIQAVTFTKKATAEMKGRIVAELSTLVHRPQESLFTDELCKLLSISERKLQGRARATLHSLLLDYSNFRVRTIDSFFQEVVRSFAYELGRSGALRIQIDSDQILRQAVLEVLARQDHEGSDKDIEAWLREMTTDSIEDGKSYSIDGELCKFAKQLESEAVKRLRSEKDFPSRTEVKALRTAAQKVITTCRQELLARADKALEALKASQVPIEKLSNGTGGVFGAVFAYKKTPTRFFDNESGALGQRKRLCAFLDATDDEEQLDKLVGKDKSKQPIREQIHPHLSIIRSTLLAFREYNLQQLPLYTTALQICQYAGLYGILIDIDDVLQELKREGKLMLISDAPSLIQALIKDNNDAPFLYEKIGTRIEHHMIDEFQDTSRMQYENFVPLLRNAESQGKDCLIVGDAKQSIYRFRNSDSTLLTTQISDDFVEFIEPTNLSDNWRSVPEIVDFNNALYPLLCAQIRSHFDELWSKVAGFGFPEGQEEVKQQLDKELSELLKAYDDVQQSTPKTKEKKGLGQVVLHRYPPKEKDKNQDNPPTEAEPEGADEDNEQIDSGALTQLPIVLVDLLKRGYRCSDIAILTRTKSTAAAIAEVLLSTTEKETEGYSLPFISEEALHVDRAYSVRFIIAVLSYLADTNITLRLAVLQEAYQQLLRLSQSHGTDLTEDDLQFLRDSGRQGLYEVVEIINARFGHLFPTSEGAYLVKLLDMLYSWEQEETADIANFLQYWQDKGAKLSISNATAEDAITLMTIHKSKGLGFPVVLLPDITWALDENLKGNKENILWCPIPDIDEVKCLRVAGVTSVPLKYASILQMSYFAKPYFEEKLKNMLDSLNLLYVATTRPKQELHIWIKEEKPAEKPEEEKEEGKEKGKKKGKKKGKQPQNEENTISTIEDLFLATTEAGEVLCDTLPAIQTTTEEPIGNSASAPRNATKATEEEGTIPLTVEGLYSYPVDKRLAILREGLEHFSEDSQRAYGRTLHLILSEIKTAGDVETAIREAEHQGYIKAKDLEGLRQRLDAVMKHPQTAHWFDGTGEVFNERAIIGGQLKTSRRPDRVIFYPDDGHIEVIDYKSGEERTAHHRQVREYMSLLRQMGYTNITGYLCYFRDEGPIIHQVMR
jgi:uvrD/REP helicase domain protein